MCAQRIGWGEETERKGKERNGKGGRAGRQGSPTGKAVYSFVSAPVEHVS